MSKKMSNRTIFADVVILGGGIAGLWTAYELSKRGFQCSVIDNPPFASFASTRNQGWLQSGALYAAYEAYDITRDCQKGNQLLREFAEAYCPDAIRSIPAFYRIRHRQDRDKLLARCTKADIDVVPRTVEEVSRYTSLLDARDENGDWCYVQVPDTHFSSHLLLQTLYDWLREHGTRFYPISSWDDIQFERNTKLYITSSGQSFHSSYVVIALGAYLPDMLTRHFPQQYSWFNQFVRTETLVTAIHKPIAECLLINLYDENPHIVPFIDLKTGAVLGNTMCLAYDNTEITSLKETNYSEVDKDYRLKVLLENYPRVRAILDKQDGQLSTQFYRCLKIRPANDFHGRSWRSHMFLDVAPGVKAFSAGKFTTAPLGAELCAQQISEDLGVNSFSKSSDELTEFDVQNVNNDVPIALPPYYHTDDFSDPHLHNQAR